MSQPCQGNLHSTKKTDNDTRMPSMVNALASVLTNTGIPVVMGIVMLGTLYLGWSRRSRRETPSEVVEVHFHPWDWQLDSRYTQERQSRRATKG